MAEERVVFQQAVEGLLSRVPRDTLAGPLRNELRTLGLDLDKPLMPGYPVPRWVEISAAITRAVYPNVSLPEAHRKLGRRLVEGYWETFIGKALLAALKVVGPRRALMRTSKNFRSANNYTECRMTERGPTDFEVWMNEAGVEPNYTAGILEAGMESAGAKEVKVEILARDNEGCTFRVRWN